MEVNLAELTEKVQARISTLDDEKAAIQNKDIENERTAMQKHFKAIETVSSLAEELATGGMFPADSGDGFESNPGDLVGPEVLAPHSDAENESDIGEIGKSRQDDVLSFLKERLDAEEADDASLPGDDGALSLRA